MRALFKSPVWLLHNPDGPWQMTADYHRLTCNSPILAVLDMVSLLEQMNLDWIYAMQLSI